jgi:hypothetical protein
MDRKAFFERLINLARFLLAIWDETAIARCNMRLSLKIPSMVAGAALAAATLLAGAPSVHAAVIAYTVSGPSPEDAGNPAAASATFTTSAGHIQIVLSNGLLTSQIISSGQAVSDLVFTLSDSAGTLGTTSASGQLGDVSGTGVVSYTAGSPTRWTDAGHLSVSGSTVTFEVLGGGKPDQLILPAIANGGQYTNANNGVQQFDPYVIGSTTFGLDLTGVTADTTVTAATFSFGTNPALHGLPGVPNNVTPAPEPGTLLLLGSALAGFGLLRRRKRS